MTSTAYSVYVELAGATPCDEQLDALTDALADYSASPAVTETGNLSVELSVVTDPATLVAVPAVTRAAESVGLSDLQVRVVEVADETDAGVQTSHTYAVHVEIDRQDLDRDTAEALTDRLRDYAASVGVNAYGWVTAQLDVAATGLAHAAERAERIVLEAAGDVGLGHAAVIQLELLSDPAELRRRSELPPPTWMPRLISRKAAADQLKISAQAVSKLVANGTLEDQTSDGGMVLLAAHVDELQRRREQQAHRRAQRSSAAAKPAPTSTKETR